MAKENDKISILTKINSILFFVIFGFLVLAGIVGIIGSMVQQEIIFPGAGTMGFSSSIVFVLIGIFGIFLTIQLWKDRLWTKWIFVVGSGLIVLLVFKELIQFASVRNDIFVWMILFASLFVLITLLISIFKRQ